MTSTDADRSAWNPSGIRAERAPESALKQNKQNKQAESITSSRCMALAAVIETLRPEWSPTEIDRALAADDRPWRTVVLASIRGAAGNDIRHPNGLRYVNPDGTATTSLPPTVRELRTAPRCQHEAPSGACALCRAGLE